MSQDHPIATPLRRATKAEACQLLQVSLSTLDRRIAAGQLAVERVQPKVRWTQRIGQVAKIVYCS